MESSDLRITHTRVLVFPLEIAVEAVIKCVCGVTLPRLGRSAPSRPSFDLGWEGDVKITQAIRGLVCSPMPSTKLIALF
jgi:hypothetical protein